MNAQSPDQSSTMDQNLRTALLLGFVSGMVCGGLELLARAYRVGIDGRFEALTRQGLWTIPLVLVVLTLVLLLMVWTAGGAWRPLRRWSTLVGLATGWAMLSPLLVFRDRFHWVAVTLLATGVGVQMGRWASRRPPAPRRLARVVAPLVTAALVLAVGAAVLRERGQRATARAAGAPPTSHAPNVLLLILDTVRASSLSLYGSPVPTTPYLEELGRRGVVFDWAISPAPWTLPSHASMFTGRWPSELRADWLSPLGQDDITLAEVLAAHGYRTGGFTANLQATAAETGLAQGFAHYDDYPLRLDVMLRSTAIGFQLFNRFILWRLGEQKVARKPASLMRSAFLRWVGDGRSEAPFFAFVNLFDAHVPYDPAPAFLGRFGPVTDHSRRLRGGRGSEGGRLARDTTWIAERRWRYEEAIATIDAEIRTMLDTLQSRGLLENTLIVVTADHGELFGEHGLFGHGHSLYLDEIRVPLLIVPPRGLPQGRRIEQPVSLRDVARTITDVVGIDGAQLDGVSLRPFWESASPEGPGPVLSMVSGVPDRGSNAPVARGDMATLVRGPWHYILNGDSTVELYRYRDDYAEAHPLQGQTSIDTLRQLEANLWSVWNGRASLAPALEKGTAIAAGTEPDLAPRRAPVVAQSGAATRPEALREEREGAGRPQAVRRAAGSFQMPQTTTATAATESGSR